MSFRRTFILLSFLIIGIPTTLMASVVSVTKENGEWVLKVDGQPYFVKGVAYDPDKVGEDPNTATKRDWMVVDDNGNGKIDAPYDAYVDANKNGRQDSDEPSIGDFQLMKNMGVNTLRVYHHASDDPSVQDGYPGASARVNYNHAPNKALLRDLYETYGIRSLIGDFLGAYTIGSGAAFADGTDYRDATQKTRMLASVRQMVMDFKDEDFLLMYVLGNENNYKTFTNTNAEDFPDDYAKFVEDAVQLIKSLDPNHPVVICNGDTGILSSLVNHAPSVDVFGANVYRDLGFGDFWQTVRDNYDKPIMLTEYGDLRADLSSGQMNETRQKTYHRTNWLEIEKNKAGGTGLGNSIGGVAFSWIDQWWQNGSPSSHNLGTGGVHNEWHGITSQGNGNDSPYLRELREVYFTYQELWVESDPPSSSTPTSSVSSVIAYPNPFRPSQGHQMMTLTQLPANARIRIYSIRGELIQDLQSDSSGTAQWDIKNRSGKKVSSGIYTLLIQGQGGSTKLKVAVQR